MKRALTCRASYFRKLPNASSLAATTAAEPVGSDWHRLHNLLFILVNDQLKVLCNAADDRIQTCLLLLTTADGPATIIVGAG